ncbi:MazG nucleotide pyrophosphohydrolase domain-containing protein [Nonomuraea wenchangensis]
MRDADEHRDLLIAKLHEECSEVATAVSPANLREELGDVLAVLQGIASRSGISWESVVSEGEAKAERSGGFIEGLVWDTALATASYAAQTEQRAVLAGDEQDGDDDA